MAFTTPRTWTYGETVTEAQFNEQLRDNFNAVWVGTNAGDIDYYTSSTTKTRLAGGTANAGKFIRQVAGGTALEYSNSGNPLYRQGGGTVNYSEPGTTNYYITDNLIKYIGSAELIVPVGNAGKYIDILFPEEFDNEPIITLALEHRSSFFEFSPILYFTNLTSSGMRISISMTDNIYNAGTFSAHWSAEGKEKA